MARKQTVEGGKKNEIIEAAFDLFFENGYDATSVRMIQKKVGSEVGLFYYYFKNKDELFNYVLDYFFENYKKEFASIVEHGRRNPCRIMTDVFEYIEDKTAEFRQLYAERIHRTMRWAIREHTLTIIEPFLEEVVKIQSTYYNVKPPLSPRVTAIYLTHGVGSAILHEEIETYKENRQDIVSGVSILMGMPEEEQELRIPFAAVPEDVEGISDLIKALQYSRNEKNVFTKSKIEEYIQKGEAYIYRCNGKIIAVVLYSAESRNIDYLGVGKDYRRKGIASRLIETVAASFPIGEEIFISLQGLKEHENKDFMNLLHENGFSKVKNDSSMQMSMKAPAIVLKNIGVKTVDL